jgi:hypothetical protein
MNSIDAAMTERCIQESRARLHAAVEREQAMMEAEARGEPVEWPAEPQQYCPACQCELDGVGCAGVSRKESEAWGELPDWIEDSRVFTCSPEHERLWARMQTYRGARDYRRCFYCQRTYTGSAPKVSIYTWPEPEDTINVEAHLKAYAQFYNAADRFWPFRVKGHSGGGTWQKETTRDQDGVYRRVWLEPPAKVWRTVDLCSEAARHRRTRADWAVK